jgi:hypothetical protein
MDRIRRADALDLYEILGNGVFNAPGIPVISGHVDQDCPLGGLRQGRAGLQHLEPPLRVGGDPA